MKMSTLHNGLHNKFGRYVFPSFIGLEFGICRLFTVPNLKCIHTVFAMLWPFKKCLFLVVQQAEVLLNFFWLVYAGQWVGNSISCVNSTDDGTNYSKGICLSNCVWYDFVFIWKKIHLNLRDLINFLTFADKPLVGLISNLMVKRIMGLPSSD